MSQKEIKINLSCVDPPLIGYAKEALAKDDVLSIIRYMPNTRCLGFVVDNIQALKSHGLFEKALLYAYTITRTNFSNWSVFVINYLFNLADRKKLLECGDPLPGDGPFTIYRGVSGRGPARRIRGISWTGSLERAIWFAERFNLEKPAVFMASVEKYLVYTYSNERKESEFLCNIPFDLKLVKVWFKKERG